MSDTYYEDSIEDFDVDRAEYYDTGRPDYATHRDLAGRPVFNDYYEDIEPELSSPTPMRYLDTAYMHHSNANAYLAEPPAQIRNTSMEFSRRSLFDTRPRMALASGRHAEYNNNPSPAPRIMQNTPASNPRNSHGIRLRPVSDLPDVYRTLFKFGVFNAVQSTCFDEAVAGDKNLAITAPTGSGKTVLFELGIIRMVEINKSNGMQAKCVYVAPTKALCTEKYQDWVKKFEPIGLKCCELTGDTVVFGHNTWGDAKNASIIVTTCEKWDSLTRNWHDHEQILSQIQLFLVDEVHILNESRGSTLEVVISRMKFRGSSIRFIVVSATVPNIEDLAKWIGGGFGGSEVAQVFEFGDEYRPCQLTRHVVGVHRRNGTNDFQFAKVLDCRLFSVLQQFSVGKPILVFCSTRKGVIDTAEQLLKEYNETESKKSSLPWSRPPRIEHSFHDKRLNEFAFAGIGVHHAGISIDDRRATEQLYLKKLLRVLVATSTLAVGVNLPAHMVVIKGVRMFQNNVSKEYSDLDIMQMLGRAGRPQFDKDGIAVILCESELEQKYRNLVQGQTILESSLHNNLAEHLNSEICLGTINDTESATSWLRSTFLYQRMQRNQGYYALSPSDGQKPGEVVDEVVMNSIAQLKKTLLIDYDEQGKDAGKLTCTEYGEIMSKYYIRRATMDLILAIPERASLRQILESICGADEFQDVKLRSSEKTVFNRLRKDIEIRFEIKKVEKTADKVFLLVQAVLAGISLANADYKNADSQPHMEAFSVFKHIARISRAALDVSIVKKDGLQIKNGLELLRCLSAKAWEDRPIVFRQIEQIGEKSIKVLAEHGITSFALLQRQSPSRIETLLNRRPPFGLEVLASVAELPQYALTIEEIGVHSDGGRNPVAVELLIKCSLVEETFCTAKSRKQRNRTFQMTTILTLTSDMGFVDVRRIPTKSLKGDKSFEVNVELTKPSQNVVVIITSETIAGVALQQVYKPDVPPGNILLWTLDPLLQWKWISLALKMILISGTWVWTVAKIMQ
ncbi:Sec63 Brl domain-containing protein [Gymnopilus junonius]|uniref:DNA 3'-5' helicase n=1 Tax=Gymnopilus junonius TaxID=109634 RepID=A0A9P5NWL7_GYMJU|nr:Sec63 Brl domain-containing protein [Gymnopilus junonius]